MSKFDPKMVRFRAEIGYRADDGFIAKDTISSNKLPLVALVKAAREIARLGELFGCGEQVEAAMKEARNAVQDWREKEEERSRG